MAAYRADIEIGVKGARSLEELRSSINLTSRAAESLNNVVGARGSLVQNIQNYVNNLNTAARSLQLVGAGTEAETKAVREYVRALGEANAARARQNSLVAQELANQRRVTPGNAGVGQQGPALPPALIRAQQVQQNWNRFFQEAAEVAQDLQSSAVARATNLKTNWNRFFQEAAEVAQDLQSSAVARSINLKNSWNTFFLDAQELAIELSAQTQQATANIRRIEGSASAAARQRLSEESARRARIQDAGFGIQGPQPAPQQKPTGAGRPGRFSNVVLGAGFPLLFGGGPGAILGGAAGGLVGGPGAFAAQIGLSALGQQLDKFAASAAKTGAALNPATADVDTLLQALGTTGTKTAEYVAKLKELEQQNEALAVVTEELTRLVGTNGVRYLRDFGQAATELSNEWAKAITQIQAALAGFLEGPLRAVVDQLERANLFRQAQQSTDPRIQSLLEQRNRPGFLGGSGGRSINDIDREIISLQAEANREAQDRGAVEESVASTLEQQKRALEAQLQLAQTDGDLTNDKVFKLSQILIDKEFEVKLQQAINDNTSVELIQLERKVKLQELARQRQQAQEAAAQKAARAAEQAADQQLRVLNNIRSLQISLVQQTLQSGDVDLARTRAVDGEIAAIQESISQQEARLNLEARILQIQLDKELSAKDITQQETILYKQIYKEQLANLEAQYQVKVRTQQLDLARLKTARQILFAEQPRALQDIRQQRGTQLAGVQAELAFPFGGDKLDAINQQLDQTSRRYETIVPLQRELQNLETERFNIAASASQQELQDLDERITSKVAQIELESQYLTQLDATEKALLRQQQVYAKYGFIADEVSRAFSDSISGLITGTTTVAEAFGRMFESIGKAFIDMATQILAQKLVFTLLQSFLGPIGGSGFSFSGAGPVSGASVFGSGQAGFNLEGFTGANFFAEGGFVTGPTRAVIGEGGEPEYVIPFSKMDGAMANWAQGKRGDAVLNGATSNITTRVNSFSSSNSSADSNPFSSSNVSNAFSTINSTSIPFTKSTEQQIAERAERETMTVINNPKPLNVRFESQVINGVEYVTAEQHQRGMAEAAERGRALTLSALQNSLKSRRQVGLA